MAKNKKDELAEELVSDLLDFHTERDDSGIDDSTKSPSLEHPFYAATEIDEHPQKKSTELVDEGTAKIELSNSFSKVPSAQAFKAQEDEKSSGNGKEETNKFGGKESRPSSAKNIVSSDLIQVENLRMAHEKIIELEDINNGLRKENEELASAGETFRDKFEEIQNQFQEVHSKYKSLQETFEEEKNLFLKSLLEKDQEKQKIEEKLKDLEVRLQTSLKKVRVRERELENRLEIVKAENQAVLQSKDTMILDLKRKIDNMSLELESSQGRSQEVYQKLLKKEDVLRRTAKALRLGLTLIDGEDPKGGILKKVD